MGSSVKTLYAATFLSNQLKQSSNSNCAQCIWSFPSNFLGALKGARVGVHTCFKQIISELANVNVT